MTPHLRGHVRAYVDRAMPPAMLHLYDRHLVCCQMCRSAADQERRIVASLRSDTGVPMSLRSALMGLAAEPSGGPTHLVTSDLGASRPIGAAGAADGAGGSGGQGGHVGSGSPSGPPVPAPPAGFRLPSRAVLPSMSSRGLLSSRTPSSGSPSTRPSSLTAPTHDPVPTVHPGAPALHRSPMRAAVVASIAAGASVAAAWGLAVAPLPGTTRPASARVPAGVSDLTTAGFGLAGMGAAAFSVGSAPGYTPVSREPRTGHRSRTATTSLPAAYWLVTRTSSPSSARPQVRVALVPSAQSGP